VPADRVLRQLFVNGRRAIRARTPNIDSPKPYVRLTGASLSKDRQTQTLTVEKGVVGKWSNAGDIEVIILKEWATTRKRLESVDAEGNTATLAPPHALIEHAQSVPRRGNACYFENAPEMLDQPGEWRLDRHSSTLYYWPLPGEDMNRAHVVAPVIDCILDVRGTQKKPVTNLHFKGLTFAHTEWQMPDVGYHGVQACYHMKQSYIAGEGNWLWEPVAAAVYFEFAESCGVTDGEVAHAGGGGIILGQWCSKNTIEGNDIHDVGANGVGVPVAATVTETDAM